MSFAPDADPRYGQFTLRTDCPRCGSNVPVNGPVAEVDCADCAARVQVPKGLLRDLADTFEDRWPARKGSDTVTLGDLTWRWTFEAVRAPPCHACGAPLRVSDAPITCECGALTTAAAPGVLREGAHSARKVFGAEVGRPPAPVAVAPVAMTCPQCGAGLTITGTHARLTPCDHCGVSVHLPDAVWRQLHPPRTVLPWTVRFEGESRPVKRARQAQEAAEADRRKREARVAQENRQREEEAARKAENAARAEEQRRQEAEAQAAADRSLRVRTLPLVVFAWGLLPAALGGMFVASAWYIAGTPEALAVWILPAVRPYAARIAVLAAAGLGLLAWLTTTLAAAWRTRQPLGDLLPLSLLYLGTASVPVLGGFFALVWAWRHLRCTEPTLDSHKARVPFTVAWPLAALYLAFPLFVPVAIAATFGMTVQGLFQSMLDA